MLVDIFFFNIVVVVVIVIIIINMNLHAKSQVSSTQNGQVMTVGMQEDISMYVLYLNLIIIIISYVFK